MNKFDDHDSLAGSPGSSNSTGSATLDVQLPVSRSNWSRNWMLFLLGIVIFASGVICGAATVNLDAKPRARPSWSSILERVASKMQRDLALTEAQRENVEQVVKAHRPALDRIRSRTITDMRIELQQVIEEMSVLLTPEQTARFRSEAQPALDHYFPTEDAAPRTEPSAD